MQEKKPVGRKDEIVVQDYNGETLVYDLRDDRALCLNETASAVWNACTGENSVSDIAEIVGSEDATIWALDELKRERLIDPTFENVPKFAGMSRRDAIKSVGMASLLAIPVVASLAAPVAAQGGTCTQNTNRPTGCACNGNGNCASQQCVNNVCQ